MLEIDSHSSFFNSIKHKPSAIAVNPSYKIVKNQKKLKNENVLLKKRLEKVKSHYALKDLKKHQKYSEQLQKLSSKNCLNSSEFLKKQEEDLKHIEKMLQQELRRQKMYQKAFSWIN
ncbi:hypothetical protein SteCoe_8240 [Stentor coeruleus]|uniref:Uncharacterized protein n=1 Tax=Stentor coeruleus TaxID=5963 RepID=A0A1R2CKM4_9CILI|nr:hypothetical protein SteCoe_8240 [Stentor coeruleus]